VARRLRLGFAVAFAVLLGVPSGVLSAPSPTGATSDLLPDLKMGKLYGLQIQTSLNGRKNLRFGTIVWNIGDGPLEARGRARNGNEMTEVYQWIADGATGREVLKPGARMFYTGDGHDHWHVQSFIKMQLYLKGSSSTARKLRKIGFCFTDTFPKPTPVAGTPSTPAYRGFCGNQASETIGPPTYVRGMGISVGYGDDYPPSIAHQEIDITGLPRGTYRLCARVNPGAVWSEKADNYANNWFWYDLFLRPKRGTFDIIRQGRTACKHGA
jgi:hypothetical protein